MAQLLSSLSLFTLFLVASAGCRSASSFEFGAYSEAERHFEKGDYPKAILKYQEYLRENPEGNLAVISEYSMAKSHEALKQGDEARRLYGKIVREHPELVWAQFSKSRLEELSETSS